MDINVVGSGGVAGLVELVKQILKPYALKMHWSDGQYTFWVTLLAFVGSLGAAAIGLFANPETSIAGRIAANFAVHPIVAVFVAAFPIAFGNQFFHKLYDLFRAFADVVRGYADKQEAELPTVPASYTPHMEVK